MQFAACTCVIDSSFAADLPPQLAHQESFYAKFANNSQVVPPPVPLKPSKTVRLRLFGDWQGARLTHSMAFGDGNGGRDQWNEPTVPPHPLTAWYTNILFDDLLGCYYFLYSLEKGTSRSTKIAAMFRFEKDDHDDGVFAAAFQWPR